ncbi:MAG: TrmH family RNA methyltransferase [Simkaniaceae bacterium]
MKTILPQSRRKFNQLSRNRQEVLLSSLIKEYHRLSSYLDYDPLEFKHETYSNRFHDHCQKAGRALNEHHFLIKTEDCFSSTPFLPITIYLDDLRSGHNVGSIIRTTEALRLGRIVFSEKTPFIDNKKVLDAAMNTQDLVPCSRGSLQDLKGPLIALETAEKAPSLFEFEWPDQFSLLIGNEEFGLSKNALDAAHHIVQIPLFGSKNSLNVANAFAIAASVIRLRSNIPKMIQNLI